MYLFVGSLDFFVLSRVGSSSSSTTTTTTILLPMQEKASIINTLIKSSSNGYHLGLTSFLGVHVLYSLLLLLQA
jgi:hypothetical protein